MKDVGAIDIPKYATNEFQLFRKEMELMEDRLSDKILKGQIEVKTEINKMIIG